VRRAKTRWNNEFSLRAEIERTRHQLALSLAQFRPLKLSEWRGVEQRLYSTFCRLQSPTLRPVRLWERFKLKTHSFHTPDRYPGFLLEKLVDAQESVWLIVNEGINESEKLWFYEGTISAITRVIGESYFMDELYIVSKKYAWLLCINHHDTLYATGEIMATKLRQLEESNLLEA